MSLKSVSYGPKAQITIQLVYLPMQIITVQLVETKRHKYQRKRPRYNLSKQKGTNIREKGPRFKTETRRHKASVVVSCAVSCCVVLSCLVLCCIVLCCDLALFCLCLAVLSCLLSSYFGIQKFLSNPCSPQWRRKPPCFSKKYLCRKVALSCLVLSSLGVA